MRAISKRAQKVLPQTAAPFLIILTLVFVFYVILLQPEDRAILLENSGGDVVLPDSQQGGEGTISQGQSDTVRRSGTLFITEEIFPGPGRISKQTSDEYDHDLTPFNFFGEAIGTEYLRANEFLVSASTFSSQSKSLTFGVNNPHSIRNMLLSFGAPVRRGALDIQLNGEEIYSGYVRSYNVGPITIDPKQLEATNLLEFHVSSPGMAFWEQNEIQIKDLTVVGNELDLQKLSATQVVDLRAIEIQRFQSGKLRFEPRCELSDVETVRIKINGELVYENVPDCGVINAVSIPYKVLLEGQNTIYFETNGGTYLVDQIELQIKLEDDDGVTYYFELDEDYFDSFIQSEPICGELDGVCPSSCSEDVDKDCCFVEYTTGYWCDVPTKLASDRCVGRVSTANADRCPSGYEDKAGNIHDDFEDSCGDDDDNSCPQGCSAFYDKDCCLYEGSKNYWCDDLPVGGVANICMTELTFDQAAFCPDGYEGEDSNPPSNYENARYETQDRTLKDDYRVIIEFYFVDDEERHILDLIINGYRRSFDTRSDFYDLDISEYVRDNNNYVQIIPKSDLSLVETRVLLKER